MDIKILNLNSLLYCYDNETLTLTRLYILNRVMDMTEGYEIYFQYLKYKHDLKNRKQWIEYIYRLLDESLGEDEIG